MKRWQLIAKWFVIGAAAVLQAPGPRSNILGAGPSETLPPREATDRAIERARRELLPHLTPLHEAPRKDYPMGRLALVVTALIEAGTAPESAPLVAALDVLRAMPLRKTYSVACYLFALESIRRHKRSPNRPPLRQNSRLRTPLRWWVDEHTRRAAAWLLKARIPGGGWAYTASVSGASTFDFSNTQFAALGLYTASRAGVRVPEKVYCELAESFQRAQVVEPTPYTCELAPSASFESILGLSPAPSSRRLRVRPGGWGYRNGGARRGAHAVAGALGQRGGLAPYPAMTAAGASTLTVTLRALGTATPLLERPGRTDARHWHGALLAACAWISRHFDQFLVDDRDLCYRLYSLEKLGDLAAIKTFDRNDWYRRGAACLLKRQHRDGSFGSYVDTSLALLFLTRSTRALRVSAAPTLYTTQPTRDSESKMNEDAPREDGEPVPALVYVHGAKGFLPAAKVLEYIGEVRHRRLLPAAREVVANFPPNRHGDLVPLLADLCGPLDAVTRFARKHLQTLTGVDAKDPAEFLAWYAQSREIEQLGRSETLSAKVVREQIQELENIPLRAQWVRIAGRRNLRTLLPLLIDELRVESVAYRRALHSTLKLWFDAPITAPKGETRTDWAATAAAWRKWLRRQR